jgi:localization factor PodJL
MKSGVPWQDIVVGRQARETARTAARRAGMSVGDWLDSVIRSSALEQLAQPPALPVEADRALRGSDAALAGLAAQPPSPLDQALVEVSGRQRALEGKFNSRSEGLRQRSGLDQAAETIRNDLADIGLMLQEAMPRRSVDALEADVRKISERLDQSRDCVADRSVLATIERGLAEVRDALHALTPAENLVDLARAVQALAHRIDVVGGIQDPSMLRQVEETILGMRRSVAHVASNDALATLSDEVRALGLKIDQAVAADGTAVLANLEQRIATLADALEAHNHRTRTVPDELESVVKRLIDKIDRLELTRGDPASLGRLDDRIARFVEKLDASDVRLDIVQGTLGHLVDRLSIIGSDLRNRAAASANVRPWQTSAGPPAAKPPTPAAAPDLPPDQPLEPGLGAPRGRYLVSPANGIVASEAMLAGAKPPIIPDPDSKASFIAAARRAAQAADRDAPVRNASAGPSEGAAGGPTIRMSKLRALIGAMTSIVLVLTSIQVARTLLGVSDQTHLPPPPLAREGWGGAPLASAEPAAAEPLAREPADAGPPPQLPGWVVPPEASGLPISVPASSSAAANLEITGSILPPAKPATTSPPRPAPTPAAAHPPSATAAEQLPAAFGSALRAAAAKGDPAAQYEVALRYAEARGVAQNPTEAAYWFEQAANQGLAPALFRLGGLHEKGLGVKKNVDLARRYYSAAGAAGNAQALHNLAVLHAEGLDGKPDYPTAARWFRKAADYGVVDSQFNLAVLYARGIGVEQNMAEAYKWFALAARDGDADAAKKRDEIAARLDPRSLTAATQAADSWKPELQPEAAAHVRTPPQGWEASAPADPSYASGERQLRGVGSKLDLAPASGAQ